MVHSKYYKELKQYLEDYHPNLVKDEEFITTRSELAQETFIECSREGMNIEECQNEVNEVLYSGLHFSLYQLVEDNLISLVLLSGVVVSETRKYLWDNRLNDYHEE